MTRDCAARNRRSSSRPQSITASLERAYAGYAVHLCERRCMSSRRSVADLCASDPTLMICERTRSNIRLVNANGPKKFVPMVISKPSTVSVRCWTTAPALLIKMSTSPSNWSGNARTDERSARSSLATDVEPPISAAR